MTGTVRPGRGVAARLMPGADPPPYWTRADGIVKHRLLAGNPPAESDRLVVMNGRIDPSISTEPWVREAWR